MIELVEKSVKCVQFKEITLEFLSNFYINRDNQATILLIYDGNEYYTNIGYEEVRKFYDKNELIYFLVAFAEVKSVNTIIDDETKIRKIFDTNSCIDYVLVNDRKVSSGKAYFYSDSIIITKQYKENLASLKSMLQEEGIHTYFVKIPQIDDITETARHSEWNLENFSAPINWTIVRKEIISKYLDRFTELEYDEAKKGIMSKKPVNSNFYNQETRTIFLVGPCIVGGWESFSGEELSSVLYKTVLFLGMSYRVVNIVMGKIPELNNKKILEHDIKQNDIVIFLEDILDCEMADIKLDYIYNNYKGYKWLYSDLPIHTTYLANKLIAEELIASIIQPIATTADVSLDNNILHRGEKQLTYEESVSLEKYLKCFEKYRNHNYGVIGACVMTCNPFTKGHYYLIEYASQQVDYLYVFIVEEDAVFFPFTDRMEMVKRGVENLKNVVILPSGKFMISKMTFKNYFEKELNQEATIDASKDTMIFRKYIAPFFGITKRFVGEETDDNITNQYNQALKNDLFGEVEVIEVLRRRVSGEIISASKVRKYLAEGKWKEIGEMVPQSTLKYLKQNPEIFCKVEIASESMDRIIDFIQSHDRVVICGLGVEAKKILQRLKNVLEAADYEKLVFYDKTAARQHYSFDGKAVISYGELISEYRNFYMLIATKSFKKDILCSLIENQISPRHIMVAFP